MEHITIPAQINNLDTLYDFIYELMDTAEIDEALQNSIISAVEEIFVNIASYAYPSGEGDVTVSAEIAPERFTLIFSDSGIPFNPLEKEDPDLTLAADDRDIGGLGIFMVKKMMDDIYYEYRAGQNVLTISKNR